MFYPVLASFSYLSHAHPGLCVSERERVCMCVWIRMNENLFFQFSQNETIAQTFNSLIQALTPLHWRREQRSGPAAARVK